MLGTAALLTIALLGGACSKIAELDGGAPMTTAAAEAPLPAQPGLVALDNDRILTDEAAGKTCENRVASCELPLAPGALPRKPIQYRLSPGDSWQGSVERTQYCRTADGQQHGEAVRASVSAVIIAADAAGNLQMEATVTDVIVSDPSIDATTVLEFPLGATTTAVFSNRGMTIRPLRPPTYAAALLTPLPPESVGVGARWEIRAPGQQLNDVRQLELSSKSGEEFTVSGITGDWLDPQRTKQRVTASTLTRASLEEVGPRERAIVVGKGVGCFNGEVDGPVRYYVVQDPPDAKPPES